MPTNNSDSKQTFPVRISEPGDLAAIAALHTMVFPDYFLTHMGKTFLQKFYSEYNDRLSFGLVVLDDQRMIGFGLSTADYAGLFSRFYRKHFLSLILITLQRFIVDPYIRKEIFKRVGHVGLALRSVFNRRKSKSVNDPIGVPQTANNEPKAAEFMVMGVDPEYRGKGVADTLVDTFCEKYAELGYDVFRLTVKPDNHRAIHFYEKTGWKVFASTEDSIHYYRPTRF